MIDDSLDPNADYYPYDRYYAGPTYHEPQQQQSDPTAWLYDPNATPPASPVPGEEWFWTGNQWSLRHSSSNTPPGIRNADIPNNGPDYDREHGLVGGYYDSNGVWVNGSPTTTTGGAARESGGPIGYGGGPRASFAPLPQFNAPRFQGPAPFSYAKTFAAPTASDLMQDPSFQFRLDQGRKALEQSAAGKGVLRTGGTLKDLINYGQNFASNEYGNVYNRKFNEYKFDYDKEADTYARNYGVQRDVFDRNYKAAYDEFQPQMTGWTTNANADQRAAELAFQREWDQYKLDHDTFYGYDPENT